MSSIRRIAGAPAARSRPATAQPAADRSGCGRRPRLRRMPHQRLQRREPALAPDRGPRPRRAAPAPTTSSPSAAGRPAPSSVSALTSIDMRQRHRRIAAAKPHRRSPRPAAPSPRRRASREPAQIVEAELRRRRAGKLRRRLRVQIAQQPIAQPVVRHRPQLLLDALERPAQRRARPPAPPSRSSAPGSSRTGYRLVNQPTVRDRSTSAEHLLAAVAFQIEQHRGAAATATPPHAAGTSPPPQAQARSAARR